MQRGPPRSRAGETPPKLLAAPAKPMAAPSPAKLTLALLQAGAPNNEILLAQDIPALLDVARRHNIPVAAEYVAAAVPSAGEENATGADARSFGSPPSQPPPPLPQPTQRGVSGKYEGSRNAAGECEGRGRYTSSDGTVYEGEWAANRQHGRGTVYYASGARYVGDWRAGRKHGTGTYSWADGRVEMGHYDNDQSVGEVRAPVCTVHLVEALHARTSMPSVCLCPVRCAPSPPLLLACQRLPPRRVRVRASCGPPTGAARGASWTTASRWPRSPSRRPSPSRRASARSRPAARHEGRSGRHAAGTACRAAPMRPTTDRATVVTSLMTCVGRRKTARKKMCSAAGRAAAGSATPTGTRRVANACSDARRVRPVSGPSRVSSDIF